MTSKWTDTEREVFGSGGLRLGGPRLARLGEWRLVTVRAARCVSDVVCGRHLDAEASVPEEVASPYTHRIGDRSGQSGVATLVRGLCRFSLSPPPNVCHSTARATRSPRRAGHLVQQLGWIARPRRCGLHGGLDHLGVDQKDRVLSLSDDDGRAAAYRLRRTLTRGWTVMDRSRLVSSRGSKRGIWVIENLQKYPFLLRYSRFSPSTRRSRRCRRPARGSSCGRGGCSRSRRSGTWGPAR